MSPSEYGLYTLFNSWLELLGVVITLRLSYGVFMQGLVRYDRNKDEYTASLQGLTTLLVLVFLAIYLAFPEFWNALTGLNTFLMLCAIASIWATAMFGFWSVRQRVEYSYKLLGLVTILVSLITPMGGVLAVLSTSVFKVEARVAVAVIVQILFYGATFVHYMRRGKKWLVWEYWIQALKFNVPLIPHYFSQSALGQAGRIIVEALAGKVAAGIYGLGSSLALLMSIVNQSLMSTLNPWLYRQIKKGSFNRIAPVSYMGISAVGVANLLLVAFAPEIVALFAPSAYSEAVWVVPPLALSCILMFVYDLFAVFEFYYEKTYLVTIASIFGAASNIVLTFLFVTEFGYISAAWASFAGYVVFIMMHYVFMRVVQRKYMDGIRVYSLKVLVGIFAALVAGTLVLSALYGQFLIRLFIVGALLLVTLLKRNALMRVVREIRQID